MQHAQLHPRGLPGRGGRVLIRGQDAVNVQSSYEPCDMPMPQPIPMSLDAFMSTRSGASCIAVTIPMPNQSSFLCPGMLIVHVAEYARFIQCPRPWSTLLSPSDPRVLMPPPLAYPTLPVRPPCLTATAHFPPHLTPQTPMS